MGASKQESDAYVARRKETERNSKRRLREVIKERKRLALAELHGKRMTEQDASSVAMGTSIHNIKWDKKGSTTKQPKYDKGEFDRCPSSLTGDDAMAALVLEGLSAFLQNKWESLEMEELRELASNSRLSPITGIRTITGGRFEFYVQVKGCTPAAFKSVLRESEKMRRKDPNLDLTDDDLGTIIGIIVRFASERATWMVHAGYSFQNFSYIVSFGPVEQQNVHIDLALPLHFQLGMLCTRRGKLTVEYKSVGNDPPYEIGTKLSVIWQDMAPKMKKKMDSSPAIQKLLDGFGMLLSPTIERVEDKPPKVNFGDMLLLPGRVMHCGPAVTGKKLLRSVLFFTATPPQDTALAYNSETQYCRSTLIHDILLHSWPLLNSKEKKYLLTKWKTIGLCHDSDDAVLNMNHKHLIVIAEAIKTTDGIDLIALIDRIADDPRWKKCNKSWDDPEDKAYTLPTN